MTIKLNKTKTIQLLMGLTFGCQVPLSVIKGASSYHHHEVNEKYIETTGNRGTYHLQGKTGNSSK